ncbi:flavin reductase family protein [Nocardia amikacinitolerans]|uniref:flavin reductase family protein n=1 Tax=Nocardia amikacinitolerans TaxID=756689 RepID=UPI0020A4AB60|nr:flavin reductase family protein [Nocardia amikacinitolerans]MCP2280113.1 NADH-FMN oxidoreductase RutF, flavin reductase (DIM6/NTAB) family [Nocardia amikacinitolerans]MCP2299927.1 NADH-FMN oxidoreductase RutF, flavin reductase (DIM6/NTAB) family [Nocardia amikacinitolerans]
MAHRLLAPRIAYLIGTRGENGAPNLIPVSNLTSVSTKPQQVAVAVYKEWKTHQNLRTAAGFTVSVPTFDQLDGVWKLGARYSKFPITEPADKLSASGLALDYTSSSYGPVMPSGLGWMACRIVARLDLGGDHGLAIGEVEQVWFNADYLTPDGVPHNVTHPLMQQTGNQFITTADTSSTISYF